jgi:hypothetical protein
VEKARYSLAARAALVFPSARAKAAEGRSSAAFLVYPLRHWLATATATAAVIIVTTAMIAAVMLAVAAVTAGAAIIIAAGAQNVAGAAMDVEFDAIAGAVQRLDLEAAVVALDFENTETALSETAFDLAQGQFRSS